MGRGDLIRFDCGFGGVIIFALARALQLVESVLDVNIRP
jgi:hypothetical protein